MINLSPKQKWIIAIATVLIGALLAASININDDAFDLLPGTAVKGDLRLLQKLGLVDRVIISLSLDNEEADITSLKRSGLALGKLLESSEYFTNVMYYLPQKFELKTYQKFQPLLPLLFDEQDLLLLEPLTSPTGIESSLQKSFNLLNSPAGYGMKHQIQSDPLGISSLFLNKLKYLRAEYSLIIEDGLFLSKDRKNCLIIAESRLELTDADAAAFIQQVLTRSFNTTLAPGVTPRIIGTLPHTLANANSVKHDLKILLPIATILLLSLIIITLKNIRSLLVIGIPFLAAPSAIAITGIIFEEMSALALGFGIVLLGIAVDFAIHLYIGLAGADSSENFLKTIRKPILLATLTTASVFVVLLFSEIPSHRQMATLALSGVVLAVLYSWYLVPLISPKNSTHFAITTTHFQLCSSQGSSPFARRCILLAWVILFVSGVVSWPNLKYNGNLQTLDAPDRTVIEDENHFRKTWDEKGDQAFIVSSAKELDQAFEKNHYVFRELLRLKAPSFQSIAPILPSLADQASNLKGWHNFWAKNKSDFSSEFLSKAADLGFSEKAFKPFFDSLDTKTQPRSLINDLPDGLKDLIGAMIRLPEQQRGKANENNYLITTTLSTDEGLYSSLLELDKANQNITLLANKKWRDQVEFLLRHDIITLSLAAAACITIITLISFRSLRATAAVLAPVISALSAMAVFSAVTGRELNMMHLLMGIMVIGLSVDYGIFTVYSKRKQSSNSSLLAVSICAISSLIGFGVLSFAQHPALSALGVTVLIGIGAAWPTAILVSPAIIGNLYVSDHSEKP